MVQQKLLQKTKRGIQPNNPQFNGKSLNDLLTIRSQTTNSRDTQAVQDQINRVTAQNNTTTKQAFNANKQRLQQQGVSGQQLQNATDKFAAQLSGPDALIKQGATGQFDTNAQNAINAANSGDFNTLDNIAQTATTTQTNNRNASRQQSLDFQNSQKSNELKNAQIAQTRAQTVLVKQQQQDTINTNKGNAKLGAAGISTNPQTQSLINNIAQSNLKTADTQGKTLQQINEINTNAAITAQDKINQQANTLIEQTQSDIQSIKAADIQLIRDNQKFQEEQAAQQLAQSKSDANLARGRVNNLRDTQLSNARDKAVLQRRSAAFAASLGGSFWSSSAIQSAELLDNNIRKNEISIRQNAIQNGLNIDNALLKSRNIYLNTIGQASLQANNAITKEFSIATTALNKLSLQKLDRQQTGLDRGRIILKDYMNRVDTLNKIQTDKVQRAADNKFREDKFAFEQARIQNTIDPTLSKLTRKFVNKFGQEIKTKLSFPVSQGTKQPTAFDQILSQFKQVALEDGLINSSQFKNLNSIDGMNAIINSNKAQSSPSLNKLFDLTNQIKSLTNIPQTNISKTTITNSNINTDTLLSFNKPAKQIVNDYNNGTLNLSQTQKLADNIRIFSPTVADLIDQGVSISNKEILRLNSDIKNIGVVSTSIKNFKIQNPDVTNQTVKNIFIQKALKINDVQQAGDTIANIIKDQNITINKDIIFSEVQNVLKNKSTGIDVIPKINNALEVLAQSVKPDFGADTPSFAITQQDGQLGLTDTSTNRFIKFGIDALSIGALGALGAPAGPVGIGAGIIAGAQTGQTFNEQFPNISQTNNFTPFPNK